jgi:hypothetical protein
MGRYVNTDQIEALPAKYRRALLGAHTDFVRKLEGMGWVELGSGCYAQVLGCNRHPDVAVKVGRDVTDGWLGWAALCMWNWERANPNPHFPRVYSVTIRNGYYVAVMERLGDTVRDAGRRHRDVFERLVGDRAPLGDLNDKYVGQGDAALLKEYTRAKRRGDTNAGAAEKEVLDLLHRARSRGFNLDLHFGNGMVRRDGTVVITDPFSVHGDTRSIPKRKATRFDDLARSRVLREIADGI